MVQPKTGWVEVLLCRLAEWFSTNLSWCVETASLASFVSIIVLGFPPLQARLYAVARYRGLAWLPPLAACDTIHFLEFLSKAHSDFTLLSFAMAVKRIDMPQRWISLLIIAVTISILAPVSTAITTRSSDSKV